MATQAPTPIQSSVSADLERELREIQTSSHTGQQLNLDDNKKRWLVVGICLHDILSPSLRIYVDPVVKTLYNALKRSDQIDIQTQTKYLRKYGATNIYLNYEAINNNKATHGFRSLLYDYKVQNAVDLSKLFLQTHMSHYTAFDEACDSSALLGMINKIDKFPLIVQTAANDVRSTVRNEWAHCNFTVWDDVKYVRSLQLIEDFIYLLNLNAINEKQMIEELDKWRKNGTSFLQGYTISLELVNEIRQKQQVLVEYAKVISKTADIEFAKVHGALIDIGETLRQYDNRISTLENTVATQGKTLQEYGSAYDADIPEIERWKQKSKDFIKTDIFTDILGIIKDNHGVLLTGVSGMGKTLTAQNIALQLCQLEGYSIVPCNTVKDIKTRYRDNVRQVFFVDDICGKYTANIKYIENWMRIKEFVNCILCKGLTKILATCRTEIVEQENVKETLTSFLELFDLTRNYSAEDKMKLARKYLKVDDEMFTDIIKKVEFSPLMCFLYSKHDGFNLNELLNSPLKTFSDEWDTLKTFDKEKLCVLLLSVIYNGTINETMFDVLNDFDKEEKRKLKDIFECCNLGRDTPRSAIKDKLNACVGTYFTKVDREYKVIHDKMFDFLCDYFGKALIAPILKYADDKLICDRVQLESIKQTHGEFTIIVHSTDEQKYLDRLKMDLKNRKLHWCLNNVQMKYKEYRIMFRDIIKDLDIDLIRNLINIKDDNGINCFIISCLRGYDELVEFFITVGADVDGQIGFFTPLTAACQAGYLKTVEILLKGRSNIDGANTEGETPLYTACVGGYYSLVNFLIEKEADINKQNKYRRTPLYATCLMGHVAIVSLLVNKGKNVFHNKDSLIAASLGVNDTIVEKLISNDCCVNTVDMNGKTALFIACEEGYTEIVKLLIENNADIYKVDSEGKTPLHAACCVGNNDIVSMLMSKDLDLNMFDLDLETPLHKACRKGSIDVISNLLAFGADINKTNRDVHTPAHIAKTEGSIVDVRILKALEEKEIEQTEEQNLNPKNKNKVTSDLIQYGWTPLYEACINGDIDTVKLLIRNRADVNMKTDSDEMPLVAACQQGHGFLIQMLIDEGADVDDALCCAAHKGYDRTIKILLHKGGNIGYKGVNGKSLLSLACEQGSTKAVKCLLEKGADFREIDVKGKTLIHVACNTGSVDLVQILLDKGLDLIICDKNGRYPLAVSVKKGFYDLSKFLIKQRCPIATSEEDIETALMSVFESGNKELSKLLVANGYTANLSHFNETVLYHACKLERLEAIIEILRRKEPTLSVKYKYGYTPMILADIGGNDDLSENLQNSICGIRNSNNSIGLEYASYKEDQKRFNCIRQNHVYTNVTNGSLSVQEYEYLFRACMYGEMKLDKFERLLKGKRLDFFIKPIAPHVPILFEQTPLCLAIRRGHTKVVKCLIKHCVDVNLTFEEWSTKYDRCLSTTILYGYTPLFAACQRKHYEIADILLESGANLNKALHDASLEGYLDTVKFLLQKGADVNSIGRFGQTALYAACIGGNYTIVKFLIDQGAFIDTKVRRASILEEPTCIHAAYLSDNHDVVQLLINRGAYVNAVGNFGRTLLHKACSDGNYKTVEILIGKGVDLNASDMLGATPLIMCVLQNIEDNYGEHYLFNYYFLEENGLNQPLGDYFDQLQLLTDNHYKVIQLLIENGADINKADKKDRTPLSLAKMIGDVKLTDILLQKVPLSIKKDNSHGRNQES